MLPVDIVTIPENDWTYSLPIDIIRKFTLSQVLRCARRKDSRPEALYQMPTSLFISFGCIKGDTDALRLKEMAKRRVNIATKKEHNQCKRPRFETPR